jgi:hypothetical protein
MDVRRASVLAIAMVIILAFMASFANIQLPQLNYGNIQIGGGGISSPYISLGHKYTYNKTIVLVPSIQDLEYVKGSYSDAPPPYYNLTNKSAPVFFNLSDPKSSLLNLFLNALAWNASKITPKSYGDLLSIASSAYVNVTGYKNVTLQPFPLNAKDTEDYSKWKIIVKYAKAFQAPSGFQPDWSYPPSDRVAVGSLNYRIINETSVQTEVDLTYTNKTYLYNKVTQVKGNVVYVYEYYAMEVSGTAYLYANNTLINSQGFDYTFYWQGGSESNTIYGYTTVPPGVSVEVYGSYQISTGAGHTSYQNTSNGTTYVYYIYYPTGPSVSTQGYTFYWYEYNVTLPLNVQVFNGTNPTTYFNNNAYFNRDINFTLTYTVWSSSPKSYSEVVTTSDVIRVGNYSVTRTWDAGSVVIEPDSVTWQSGNAVYYYLDFSVQYSFASPPPWINQSMTYNRSAAVSWFYLEQNASLAHALYSFIMDTINRSDLQYWKFEYFALAGEFVMYTFNTTDTVYNNTLELESFYENWSLVNASVLNLSTWPKFKYFNGTLMFFNVSRIPTIYNATIYFNVSGDYEVYLTDVYNGLYYHKWLKMPFGNEYYSFYPPLNKTVYFYLNSTNSSIPYVGETLGFVTAVYVPYIYYAIFQQPTPVAEEITAIWNGTTWLT